MIVYATLGQSTILLSWPIKCLRNTMLRPQVTGHSPRNMGKEMGWSFWPSSISNFVWLCGSRDIRRVLCVSDFAEQLASEMRPWFESVTSLNVSADWPPPDHDLPTGFFDVVLFVADGNLRALNAIIPTLKENGVLHCFCSRRTAAATIRSCKQKGLAMHARYLVGPSLFRPIDIVPDSPSSISAYLNLSRPASPARQWLQTVALNLGWRPDGLDARLLTAVRRA
jgi:hypothetical protein